MSAQRKPLSRVPSGSTVRATDGSVWTVAEFSPDGTKARLVPALGDASAPVVLSTSTDVEVVEETLPTIPGISQVELAEEVIHARLDPNATRVATIYENGKRYAPTKFPDPASLLGHLYVLHGMDVSALGDTPFPELEKLHSRDHTERTAGARFLDHFHNQARFENV